MAKSSGNVPSVEPWAAVWNEVDQRRKQLGWSLGDLYDNTGVSETTFRKMRTGGPISRESKVSKMCIGLGWTTESVNLILDGFAPELADTSSLLFLPDIADEVAEMHSVVRKHEERIADLERLVQGMTERLLALAERSTLPDVDDEPNPGESRAVR